MPNAYDVNPMMMEALHQITPFNLPMFLMTNPEFVSVNDTVTFKKSLSSMSKYALGALIAGITFNVQAKRVYPGIVSLPFYTRLPLRLIILGIPFGLINSFLIKDIDRLNQLNHKYYIRIVKFRRTGNMEYMFPREDSGEEPPVPPILK